MRQGQKRTQGLGSVWILGAWLLAGALSAQEPATGGEPDTLARDVQDLRQDLTDLARTAGADVPGDHRFLVTGFGKLGYTDVRGEPSTFGATLGPIFLWQIEDRMLVESELELELEGGATEVELEYANFSYIVSDAWMVGGGKFLTPFGIFSERIHPTWINRLPDMPLAFAHGTGIVPMSSVGVWARGGLRKEESRLNYAFFLANGPSVAGEVEHGDHEEALAASGDEGHGDEHHAPAAGSLQFHNFEDFNSNKAVGGRLGFLPVPELEIGVSGMWADVLPPGEEQASAVLYGVDLTFQHRIEPWKGNLRLLAEWAWSTVDPIHFEGVREFDNQRNGGYVQASFRFLGAESTFWSRIEPVVRFDRLNQPNDVEGSFDEQRWTFGVDYWLGPSAALKVAWRLDEVLNGEREEGDALLVQLAMGF